MGVRVRQKVQGGDWWVFIAHQGRRTSRKVGTEKAALEAAEKIQAKLTLGEPPLRERTNPESIPTVEEYWKRFKEIRLQLFVAESTAAKYRHTFAAHILPAFGKKRLDEVTYDDMEGFVGGLIERGLAKETIRSILRQFGRLYTYAQKKKVVGNINPATGLSDLYEQANEAKKIHPLNREESEAFLLSVQQHAPQYYSLFLTALHSGLRAGELAALQWADIDWFNKNVTVQRSIDRLHRKEVPTKSKKIRHVKVSDKLLGELKRHRVRQKAFWMAQGVNELPVWVFANDDGGWPDMSNLRERQYRACLAKAGLQRRRLHDLRHSYASQLLADGCPPAFIQAQLGHAHVELTLRIYSHYLPSSADRQYLANLPGIGSNPLKVAR